MRRLLRFLLLAMGCAVMVATSRTGDYSPALTFLRLELRAGVPQTLSLSAVSKGNGNRLVPQLHLSGGSASEEGANARVIGFVSEQQAGQGRGGLDPSATFTVGQEVEGFGTVAFIREAPFSTHGGYEQQGSPWVLPEAKSYFVTLLAQNATISTDVELATPEMASTCQCVVAASFDSYYGESPSFSELGPDGGVGDGGVGDGG